MSIDSLAPMVALSLIVAVHFYNPPSKPLIKWMWPVAGAAFATILNMIGDKNGAVYFNTTYPILLLAFSYAAAHNVNVPAKKFFASYWKLSRNTLFDVGMLLASVTYLIWTFY